MLWVERDLAAIVEAIFQRWDTAKKDLIHNYLYAMDAVRTPNEICATIEQGKYSSSKRSIPTSAADRRQVTGKRTKYVVLNSTGNDARDTMFNLYNMIGTYPGVKVPDPNVLNLGVELHGIEQFVRERLVPHLERVKESKHGT